MGILRLLLAVSVLLTHLYSSDAILVGGASAVQLFYLISGFYMGLVLTEKYTGPGSYRLFLGNRFLRLYPVYWAVLALATVCWLVIGNRTGFYGPLRLFHAGLRWPIVCWIVAVQLVIFGMDSMLFFSQSGSGVAFTSHFAGDKLPLWYFHVVPPAWSLSLELAFYLIAPLLVRLTTSKLLWIALASLALRLGVYWGLGWTDDPWTHRSFPCELLFFIAGLLAYRRYRVKRSKPRRFALLTAITAAVVVLLLAYPALPGAVKHAALLPKQWALYGLVWLALPSLFLWSNPPPGQQPWLRSIDRWIGELSFPLYIVHYLVVQMVGGIVQQTSSPLTGRALIIATSLAAAAALALGVMGPIERVRRWRTERARSATVEQAADVVTP